MRVLSIAISFLITTGSCYTASAGSKGGELMLGSVLMTELNKVLQASDSLHAALVAHDEEQTELTLRDLLLQLDRTRSFTSLAKPHERSHLTRILDAAKTQFEQTLGSVGEDRRARFENGYNQLANIVRIYKVDRAYAIFFCPKDRTNWVQRGNRPENPFRGPANKEACGMKIPR
jgi:hypothetical protein